MATNYCALVLLETHKAYIAVLFVMTIYAGNALISKLAMSEGMNPFVFVAYRQAFATLTIAPFAYFFESRKAPSLSYKLLCKIFLLSMFGITICLNLYYAGIKYTSATFAAACTNLIPAITFVLALLFRMERVSIRDLSGLAKVFGTLVGVSGAMVFAFVKGHPLNFMNWGQTAQERPHLHSNPTSKSNTEWIKGSLIMLLTNSAWSLWLVFQGPIMKEYPAKLNLTALQCFFSSVQSVILALAVHRNLSSWKLGWDLNLFSVAYCGVIVTGMTYWLQVWVVEKKGPVFMASFTPLSLILTAIVSAFLWKETLFWGRVGGAMLLVVGLYSVLWGKHKEKQDEKEAAKVKGEQANDLQRQEDSTLERITVAAKQ